MALGASLQNTIRKLIDKTNFISSTASLYSFSSSIKETNREGEETVHSWGTATSIRVIGSSNTLNESQKEKQGDDRTGKVTFLIRDSVSISPKDKVTYSGVDYYVDNIEPVARIGGTLVAQRVMCHRED